MEYNRFSRITAGHLRVLLSQLPDDAIVCLYSDSEGNQMSTALDVFTEIVGQEQEYDVNGKKYKFIGGSDTFGIDMEKDKGKTLVYLQPSL